MNSTPIYDESGCTSGAGAAPIAVLCVINILGVKAVAYQREDRDWEVVESAMPSMVQGGQRAKDSTIYVVAAPGSIVQNRARECVRFSHLVPGPTGWLAVVSGREGPETMSPYALESVQ